MISGKNVVLGHIWLFVVIIVNSLDYLINTHVHIPLFIHIHAHVHCTAGLCTLACLAYSTTCVCNAFMITYLYACI